MSAGLAIQGITKNLVFSTRRTDKAVNQSDNLAVSIGNADVASGQIKNALDSLDALSKESKVGVVSGFKGAKDSIKAISNGNKLLKGVGRVVEFTADNINPVITLIGGVKVITAKDKEEALIEEAPALGGMFAFEAIAKNVLEMEKKVVDPVTGKKMSIKRTAFYKSNPMLKAQSENIEKAINDYFATKKLFNKISLTHAPSIAKGLLFVGASITGYTLGQKLGKKINEKRKHKVAKNITFRPNHAQEARFVTLQKAA